MITREVREWMQRIQRGQYSYEDAMYELMQFSSYLSLEEMKMIKDKIKQTYTNHPVI